MSFLAKTESLCAYCPENIRVGDPIKWSRTGDGLRWHETCTPMPTAGSGDKLATLEAALRDVVAGMSTASAVAPLDEARVREIASEVADIASRRIEISVCVAPSVKINNAHEALPDLVKLVSIKGMNGHRQNVYMYGPAGSGKSTGARQASDVLGIPFSYMSCNPMMPDSRILGFMSANGQYIPSNFFRLYTEGGVFCFDEIDNASASFVTTLNALLENGHGAFPHGNFPRHPDFVCVCTANTIGRGGDIHYPERRALDGAFLERFLFLNWGYDFSLTSNIVDGILGREKGREFLVWVTETGDAIKSRFPTLIVSPRAYIQGALLELNGMSRQQIEACVISRGVK